MTERNFSDLASRMRQTGSVRFIGDEYLPKSPMNTAPDNIAKQVMFEVFSDDPEKFRKDDRPDRMEVRFHWKDLSVEGRLRVLELCKEKVGLNGIAKEREIENKVFDLVYYYLNLQVT